VFVPFLYACGVQKGYVWKFAVFYLIMNEIDAIYDFGMFLRFYVHGPSMLRNIISLDDGRSFASI
jgi:hypothetical protein